jgi:hypothetical protein
MSSPSAGSDPSPTKDDQNRANLEQRLASWPSMVGAGEMQRLYADTTRVHARDRVQTMSDVLDRLRSIQSLLGAAHLEDLNIPRFLGELQFGFTGKPRRVAETVGEIDFQSTSGQTTVIAAGTRPIGEKRAAFTARLIPGERLGLEGLTNEVVRQRLNRRVSEVVDRYPGVRWRPGKVGAWEVFVDIPRVSLDAQGLSHVRRVLTDVLTRVEGS